MSLESEIEREARRIVEEAGGMLLKVRVLGARGFPDRLALMPGGKIAFVEFKQEGKKPEAWQFRWLHAIRKLGFEAFWTHKASDVKAWMAHADAE